MGIRRISEWHLLKFCMPIACRTHVNWIDLGERKIFSPDLVIQVEEIVHRIQSNLKAAKA
jgi:hypothetical protein